MSYRLAVFARVPKDRPLAELARAQQELRLLPGTGFKVALEDNILKPALSNLTLELTFPALSIEQATRRLLTVTQILGDHLPAAVVLNAELSHPDY
jgi:hypothetical protein